MDYAQILSKRITEKAHSKGMSVNTALKRCNIADSAFITKIRGGTNVGYMNLVKLANFFECSIDYLLGRTDEVCPNKDIVIQTGDVKAKNGSGNVDVDTSVNINTNPNVSSDVLEMIDMIQKLPLVKRAEVIIMINKMIEGD